MARHRRAPQRARRVKLGWYRDDSNRSVRGRCAREWSLERNGVASRYRERGSAAPEEDSNVSASADEATRHNHAAFEGSSGPCATPTSKAAPALSCSINAGATPICTSQIHGRMGLATRPSARRAARRRRTSSTSRGRAVPDSRGAAGDEGPSIIAKATRVAERISPS